MGKFKVGDEVIVLDGPDMYRGERGIITQIITDNATLNLPYKVQFGSNAKNWCPYADDEMELLETVENRKTIKKALGINE